MLYVYIYSPNLADSGGSAGTAYWDKRESKAPRSRQATTVRHEPQANADIVCVDRMQRSQVCKSLMRRLNLGYCVENNTERKKQMVGLAAYGHEVPVMA